jgi:hypothetical protein
MQWITRVPATVSAAQAVLAQTDPQSLASRTRGDRDHESPANAGGMEPRWVLIDSERRQAQARRTVDQQWRQHSAKATHACQP